MSEEQDARAVLRSLIASNVIGLNDDGSVWVFGGLAADGKLTYTHGGETALAPVWRKGERYATADSPFADVIRRVSSREDRIAPEDIGTSDRLGF